MLHTMNLIWQFLYWKIFINKMKKLLGIVVLGLLFCGNAYADSKFDKELKKISKHNGFVDTKGKVYSKDQITDKKILF